MYITSIGTSFISVNNLDKSELKRLYINVDKLLSPVDKAKLNEIPDDSTNEIQFQSANDNFWNVDIISDGNIIAKIYNVSLAQGFDKRSFDSILSSNEEIQIGFAVGNKPELSFPFKGKVTQVD